MPIIAVNATSGEKTTTAAGMASRTNFTAGKAMIRDAMADTNAMIATGGMIVTVTGATRASIVTTVDATTSDATGASIIGESATTRKSAKILRTSAPRAKKFREAAKICVKITLSCARTG